MSSGSKVAFAKLKTDVPYEEIPEIYRGTVPAGYSFAWAATHSVPCAVRVENAPAYCCYLSCKRDLADTLYPERDELGRVIWECGFCHMS